MKIILTAIIIFLAFTSVFAQNSGRSIRFHTYPKDSINLHMDENYFLIEDTCSSIVRYGHYRFKDRKFFGPFRDLNKLDPQTVVAEGNYTQEGKLDGPLKLNFLNGDPQAEGTYDQGRMTGHWMLYYPGNLKKLEFESKNGEIQILNAWENTGKQTITNGAGTFKADLGFLTWEGKLRNGRPDGTWKSRKTDDRTGTVLSSETFKAGAFVKGGGPGGAYNDKSRIILVGDNILPINNMATFIVSQQACDPSMSRKKVMYATYRDGAQAFSREIGRVIAPVFAKIDLQYHNNKEFTLQGIIDEKGKISTIKYVNTFDDKASSTLLSSLYSLPFLFPTTVNGVPVRSGISFKFTFNQGSYSYAGRYYL